MDHPEISIQISDRIRGGELPSVVLRALLKEHPDCERRHKLGSYLIDAFDDSTLIHYAWRWKAVLATVKRHRPRQAADAVFGRGPGGTLRITTPSVSVGISIFAPSAASLGVTGTSTSRL